MSPRTVVIGGGVIGLAIAWRLAQHRADVTVVDPTPGRGASWAAAGMLAPVTEAELGEPDLLALHLAAAQRWPGFATELAAASGLPVDLHTAGTVVAALDAGDRGELDELAARLASLGLDVAMVRGRQLRQREPALAPGIRGGLDVAGDQAVDNRQVVTALTRAGQRAGVALHDAEARTVEDEAGRVTGVHTDQGRLPADVVVVAAGCGSARLALPGDLRLPVRPVKGQILRLHDTMALLTRVVRGRARGRPIYLVPRAHGEVVVGATVEDVGFDTTVTAGATLELLRAAAALVPGIRELALCETRAGLRPATPDNAPIVGQAAVDGLVLATGHGRHGILQAPVTADAVAALVTDGGDVGGALAPFTLARFQR